MLEALAFRQAREALATLRDHFGALVQAQPEGWQRSYVVFRRTMQEALTQLGETGCCLLSARAEPEMLRKFEDSHAHYRHVVTLHQADWPVVSIRPDDPGYLHSRNRVGAAYHEFTAVMDQIFGEISGNGQGRWLITPAERERSIKPSERP